MLAVNKGIVGGLEGLSVEGQRAIAVLLLCLVLWISNAIPLAITGILAIVLVPVLGVLSSKVTYSLFGNEAVFFILGAFILAGAVMHSGISNRLALYILDRFGGSPRGLLITVFLLAAALSFIMSEHAVASMLFPIVIEISKSLGLKPGKSNYGKLLFFAMAWGCIIGGVATFLGGARVPLAVGILQETTGEQIGFLDYSSTTSSTSNGFKTQPFVTERQWELNYLKILDGLSVNIGLNISLLLFSEMKLKSAHG